MNTYRFQPSLDMKTADFPFEQIFETDEQALKYNEELTVSNGLLWKKVGEEWHVWENKTKRWILDDRIFELLSMKVREDRKTGNCSAELYDANGILISHLSLSTTFDTIRYYGLTVKNVRRDKWGELSLDGR